MDLSHIKMVVTDLDGTLLNANHEVTPRFLEIFKALRNKGIIFVAASGRHYDSMLTKLNHIKNDSIIISSNGALVKQRDDVLLNTPLHTANVQRVLETIKHSEHIYPVLCSYNNAFVQRTTKDFINRLQEHYPNFDKVTDLTTIEAEALSISLYHFEGSEAHIYPILKHLEDDMKVKVSAARWADISHQNANKGYALRKVMEQYQITSHEVMVFGDYLNDLEMLQLTDFSFAMANAHPKIKEIAKHETVSNKEFGVEIVLEQLLESSNN